MASDTRKRKREAEEQNAPRISYTAGSRTFDRLFKEESLEALRRVVRRKLNLSETTAIQLAQVRGTTKVDLEDDDDFDAFRSLAVATGSVNVQITYDAPILSENFLLPGPEPLTLNPPDSRKRSFSVNPVEYGEQPPPKKKKKPDHPISEAIPTVQLANPPNPAKKASKHLVQVVGTSASDSRNGISTAVGKLNVSTRDRSFQSASGHTKSKRQRAEQNLQEEGEHTSRKVKSKVKKANAMSTNVPSNTQGKVRSKNAKSIKKKLNQAESETEQPEGSSSSKLKPKHLEIIAATLKQMLGDASSASASLEAGDANLTSDNVNEGLKGAVDSIIAPTFHSSGSTKQDKKDEEAKDTMLPPMETHQRSPSVSSSGQGSPTIPTHTFSAEDNEINALIQGPDRRFQSLDELLSQHDKSDGDDDDDGPGDFALEVEEEARAFASSSRRGTRRWTASSSESGGTDDGSAAPLGSPGLVPPLPEVPDVQAFIPGSLLQLISVQPGRDSTPLQEPCPRPEESSSETVVASPVAATPPPLPTLEVGVSNLPVTPRPKLVDRMKSRAKTPPSTQLLPSPTHPIRTRSSTKGQAVDSSPLPHDRKAKKVADLHQMALNDTSDYDILMPSEEVGGWTTLIQPSPPQTDSQFDELRDSSEASPGRLPLFEATETQLAFPYSQWQTQHPEGDKSGPPSEADEEEVEAQVTRLSQPARPPRPSQYRKLTDIASQPSQIFSTSVSLPRHPPRLGAKKDLWAKIAHEESEGSGSDESDEDEPGTTSHIPKSRRAGR